MGRTVMRFSRLTFRPRRHTRRPSRETTHEDYFHHCALSAWTDVCGLRSERVSQLHPPATAGESAGNSVPCCRQHIALCSVLLRGADPWWAAAALRLFRATCADTACGGALQHTCVSPDAFAGHRSGTGGLCAVGAGLPSVPRKLQGHLQREACDAGMNCVAACRSPCFRAFTNCAKEIRRWQCIMKERLRHTVDCVRSF